MSSQAYIFELSAESFPASALQNSYQLPVLAEFMGVWSGPCIQMADVLSVLANEFAGRFIFAKVDIDEQQSLREQYKIENVPTLVVLQNGEEVRREVGEMQESELRRLLKDYGIFHESDELREQAMEQLFRIQEQNPDFRDGAAREMVGLLAGMLMDSDPEAGGAYRRRLANMLNDS